MAPKVFLLTDNLRVGGLERLALDQLFCMAESGIEAELLVRDHLGTKIGPNFIDLEENRIQRLGVLITPLPKSKFRQLIYFLILFRRHKKLTIINHSVGATPLLKIAKWFRRNQSPIFTFIHQLPSLSDNKQRTRRFVYTLFSDKTFGYSTSVVRDWNLRVKDIRWLRTVPRSNIYLLKNGVYLPRLPIKTQVDLPRKATRIIFIGRNVAWKNLDYVIRLFRYLYNSEYFNRKINLALIMPSADNRFIVELQSEFGHNVQFFLGKKLEDIHFYDGDINVYPVDYGPEAQFTESVSLNCLEMACLGIPSLVTPGGTETWPKLVDSGLLREVEWENFSEVSRAIVSLSNREFSTELTNLARREVDIMTNVTNILTEVEVFSPEHAQSQN